MTTRTQGDDVDSMETVVVIAAGGVVYRYRNDRVEIVLVGSGEPTEWRLPKGMAEAGETLDQTALREVHEEAGVVAEIQMELGRAQWNYLYNNRTVNKETVFFLMRYTDSADDQRDGEYDRVMWAGIADCISLLHFGSEKEIVRQAALALNSIG